MGYKLKKGIRETAWQASPYMQWAVCWAHIFIDCPTCNQSIGLKFDSNEESLTFSDEEFIRIVHNNDWDFIPNVYIKCPECRQGELE